LRIINLTKVTKKFINYLLNKIPQSRETFAELFLGTFFTELFAEQGTLKPKKVNFFSFRISV